MQFFSLIAVAAAVGKAEDGASPVALVPFIAEKGKKDVGAGADEGICRYADITAVSRVHMEYLLSVSFPLWGAICYFRIL